MKSLQSFDKLPIQNSLTSIKKKSPYEQKAYDIPKRPWKKVTPRRDITPILAKS